MDNEPIQPQLASGPQPPAPSNPPQSPSLGLSPSPAPIPAPKEPAVTSSGISIPTQPVTESIIKTQTTQQASAPMEPKTSGETPKKLGGGMTKWIGIGAGVLGILALAGAGLYFGGVFTPKPSATDLMGAAQEPLSEKTTQVQTQANTQTVENISSVTQIALTTCQTGQVKDPVTNRCACDINNNYFEINLPGAFGDPTTGQGSVFCTTCAALTDEIFQLGQSNDPKSTTRKLALEALASDQNCTPCAIFDDRIAEALQKKQWLQYYNLVVQKSQDNVCGRTLSTCDSLKWQIIFLSDLRVKAAKDTISSSALEELKTKQVSLAQELGTNTACYKLENLCAELKLVYEEPATAPTTETPATSTPTTTTQSTDIGTAPLMGTADSSPSATTQQTQPVSTQEASSTDGTQVDLAAAAETAKLFGEDFYRMHCPINGVDGTAPPPATAPKKVKRT